MSTCPDGRCDGSGFLYDETARVARPCSCRPRRLARKRAAAIEGRIPKKYRGVSFDREPLLELARTAPGAIQRVRRYVQAIDEQIDAGKGIWFTGNPGTGKTTLAMLISKTAIEAGRSVAIYSLPHLLALLRDTYNEGGPSLVELLDRLTSIELLHIDDIGAEQSSAWVLEQLYTIINGRYEEERALILTTNLVGPATSQPPRAAAQDSPGEPKAPATRLEEQLGARTVSRIYEICGPPLGLFGDTDHRRASGIDYEDAEIDYTVIGTPGRRPGAADTEPAYGEARPRFAS